MSEWIGNERHGDKSEIRREWEESVRESIGGTGD